MKIILAYLLARAPGLLFGAAAYAVVTILYTLLGSGGSRLDRGTIVGTLFVCAILAAIPFTRSFGIGFFAALLVSTVLVSHFWTDVWWDPFRYYVHRATAPARKAQQMSKEKKAWLDSYGSAPLEIKDAIFRVRQLQSGCVQQAITASKDGKFPTALDVTSNEDCRGARGDARDIDAEWPERFGQGDKGWRWALEPSETPSRWGGPGFLLTMRPESLLNRAGPIIELDGQDVLRIRDLPSLPSRIVSTPVPAMQRLRECLLLAGAAIGDDAFKWQHLAESSEFRHPPVCPDLRVEAAGGPMPDGGPRLYVSMKLPEGGSRIWTEQLSIGYRLLAPRRFELYTKAYYRDFLLSADGTMHVTAEDRPASTADGPPLPCEMNPGVSCD
jgi:hypothetical protein